MKDAVQSIDPFACKMWECHDRLDEFIDEESCREVIGSFVKDGQKHAVLARPCKSSDAKYELVYGARRLFAARFLNTKLLAAVRDLDDRQAFIEMGRREPPASRH
jgi:ParB family transcriptional regulator, chromosome partitioning protein